MFESQTYHLSRQMTDLLCAANEMDSTLLITGKTGTGKSHLAYAIHRSSPKRAQCRWFKVNLATLSENLIESELFGHERGAFTGADCRRVGRLESCNGGTVFLDEIGELPIRLQAKLLDFIQYKRVTPVGSNRDIELDVRIIVATNKDLESAVAAGQFREDLYHRLNVFHARMPDLATNRPAILGFARQFLGVCAERAGKNITTLTQEVEQTFLSYPWPGNIRELENAVEFAVAMEKTDKITVGALPEQIGGVKIRALGQVLASDRYLDVAPTSGASSAECERIRPNIDLTSGAFATLQLPITMKFRDSKEAFERTYLEHVLRKCSGQINLTSRRTGLNKVSLTEKIRKYGIDWKRIRLESFGPALSRNC